MRRTEHTAGHGDGVELDKLAATLGVRRNKGLVIPCSGCGVACHPCGQLYPGAPYVRGGLCECFCVTCVAKMQVEP